MKNGSFAEAATYFVYIVLATLIGFLLLPSCQAQELTGVDIHVGSANPAKLTETAEANLGASLTFNEDFRVGFYENGMSQEMRTRKTVRSHPYFSTTFVESKEQYQAPKRFTAYAGYEVDQKIGRLFADSDNGFVRVGAVMGLAVGEGDALGMGLYAPTPFLAPEVEIGPLKASYLGFSDATVVALSLSVDL